MMLEWRVISNKSHKIIGAIICLLPTISLGALKYFAAPTTIFFLYFAAIGIIDTSAMLGGKFFGGPQLAKKISPNKTISGIICGILCCCTFILVTKNLQKINYPGYYCILFGTIFTLVAQGGDLLVSRYKRKFHIKESGNCIPGHGGVLDRADSIIFTAPLTLITYYALQKFTPFL